MQIHDLGEEGFIESLIKQFPTKDTVKGIGDDCAVIPYQEESLLVTTDALVEGIHFIKEQIPPSDLGYKTLAVNVSDIAAMGGIPKYAFLSLAVPKNLETGWLENLIKGLKEGCKKWDIQLLGGDTVSSKRDIFLNLTLMGSALNSQIKYRDQAKSGDIICLTGNVGDSGGGLKILQEENSFSSNEKKLVHAHFHPEVDPKEGSWLGSQKNVHAMLDVSDGLNIDLKRVLNASKCGAQIQLEKLPLSKTLLEVCEKKGLDPIELGLLGGEDYVLLCTVAKERFDPLAKEFYQIFHKPLYEIGQITDSPGKCIYLKEGKPASFQVTGYKHF